MTNLSGRGVGMDVVKKTIEALRGSIDVKSDEGSGSEIALRIPLTLAIIDGLLVRVGNGNYVIRCLRSRNALNFPQKRIFALVDAASSRCATIWCRSCACANSSAPAPSGSLPEGGGYLDRRERVGLVVDQIIGDHQTVIKSMSKLHDQVSSFSGATILGDGNVALILDVAHLIAAGQQQEAQMRAAG